MRPLRRGVAAIICERGRLLAIRRSAQVSAPLAICFPGGGIEPGETEADALCRELHEELSLAIRPLVRLGEIVTPWNVHLAWWSAERVGPTDPQPHLPEVAEYFWFTPDEMLAHPDMLASNRDFLLRVQAREIDLGLNPAAPL